VLAMAVQQMQRINIYALRNERKRILEFIQRHGYIELENKISENKVFEKDDENVSSKDDNIFFKEDISSKRISFEKNAALAVEAISTLKEFSTKKDSMLNALNGRRVITAIEYNNFSAKHDNVLEEINHVLDIHKKISEKQVELLKLETQKETLTSWKNLDICINFDGTKYTSFFIGTLPGEWTIESILDRLSEFDYLDGAPALDTELIPAHIEIISSSKEQACILAVTIKEKRDLLLERLRALGFSFPDSSLSKIPKDKIEEIDILIKDIKKEIIDIIEELKNSDSKVDDFKLSQDYNTMRADKYEAIGQLLQTNNLFILSGYIPSNKAQAFMDKITSKFEIFLELEEPSEEDDVPTLLKNNGFSNPLESTIESFGVPSTTEIDPTMIMSLFYYLLFGLMLSDAAYGLIMVIACGLGLIKFKNTIELPMKKTLKMYMFCGLATVFWGVMFGSYFGDLVDVVSEGFFGNKISIPPLWFFPTLEPMRMLVFSMLFGLIHLLTGLTIKLFNILRTKDYKSIVYDVVFWYMLIIGSVVGLMSVETFTKTLGLDSKLPSVFGSIGGLVAAIAAIGIIATNGRESKNPFKRFLKGLYALYGITGYLSDVLSYSRLLALGLATGVICTVINKMAAMAIGVPFVGPIIFIVIIIFGHLFNIGINLLGAYVHTTRLQYVEFFGKFYDGGGRKFRPLKINTKYFKFKEEK
jgi:V/A-type H+-transporting ATPase subunit I